jgi:hypothetical protein
MPVFFSSGSFAARAQSAAARNAQAQALAGGKYNKRINMKKEEEIMKDGVGKKGK